MLIKLDRPAKGLMPGLENLARSDKNYSLTTSVKAGELVAKRHLIESTQVFRLTRDVLAGEPIGQSDIARDNLGLTMTSPNQRFPERLLAQAVASRDLAKGQILSRRDFSVKHMVMTTISKLSRGQKLSAANTQLKEFYGRLPDDALLLISDIVQMETIRPIRVGQMLRLSDLKPAAMINKGDSVTLTVEAGLLSVSVAMIALESGKIDQQISLLNPESNETVRALVIGPGQARGL
jgi:flagella basal body P-ring formation protein FlgA